MTHLLRTAALTGLALASALAIPAGAQSVHVGSALQPPAVYKIPDFSAVPVFRTAPNAPIMNAEFSTPIRTPADRITMRVLLRQQRAADAARFAAGAGNGVTVQLRRPKY
jgi:hypothetical protein